MIEMDPVLLHRGRLAICAALMDVEEASFRTLAEATGASDSLMSKNVSALSEAGYVVVTKDYGRGEGRTWIALTERGRRAVVTLAAELNRLAGPKEN